MIVIAIPDTCLTILINQLPAQLMSNNDNDYYYYTCSSMVSVVTAKLIITGTIINNVK